MGGELLGKFDGLVLDRQAADCDVIGSYGPGGGRAISVRYFPAGALGGFVGARLGRVVNGVGAGFADGGFGKLGGEDLVRLSELG